MSGTQKLEQALKSYADRFDNLDDLTNPQIMLHPDFPEFLMAAVNSGVKIIRDDIDRRFGPISWEW